MFHLAPRLLLGSDHFILHPREACPPATALIEELYGMVSVDRKVLSLDENDIAAGAQPSRRVCYGRLTSGPRAPEVLVWELCSSAARAGGVTSARLVEGATVGVARLGPAVAAIRGVLAAVTLSLESPPHATLTDGTAARAKARPW